VSARIPELVFSTVAGKVDSYVYHFGLDVEADSVLEEKKKGKIQQIVEETRKEVRQMFGVAD
jgi:hypothetical protein